MPVIPAVNKAALTADTVLPAIPTSGAPMNTAPVARPKAHSTASATTRPNQMRGLSPSGLQPTVSSTVVNAGLNSASLPLPSNFQTMLASDDLTPTMDKIHSQSFSGGIATHSPMILSDVPVPMISSQNQIFAEPEQTGTGSGVDYFSQGAFSSGTVDSPMPIQHPLMANPPLDEGTPIMHSYPPMMNRNANLVRPMDTLAPPNGGIGSENVTPHVTPAMSPALGVDHKMGMLTSAASYPFPQVYARPISDGFEFGTSQSQPLFQTQHATSSAPLSPDELLSLADPMQQPHVLVTRPTADILSESNLAAIEMMGTAAVDGNHDALSVLNANALPHLQGTEFGLEMLSNDQAVMASLVAVASGSSHQASTL